MVTPGTKLDSLPKKYPWLNKEKLVVKPDQLFGKRGKHGLIKANASFIDVKKWIKERMVKETTVGKVTDKLTHFLIETYVKHDKEFYVAIKSNRQGDTVYVSTHGGVDIESVWDTVAEIQVPVDGNIDKINIEKHLPKDTPKDKQKIIATFINGLYKFNKDLGYAYI